MNIKKNATILFVLMLVSKLLGVVRESVISFYYGTSVYADVYLSSSNLPNLIFGIVATGLVSTFIPIYSRVITKEGKKQANKFMNNILTIVFLISVVLLVIGLLFTEEIVRIQSPGYDEEAVLIAIDFTRITLFALLTNGVYSIFNGFLQYHGRFSVAPLTGLVLNTFVIVSIILSNFTRPVVMVYGLIIGGLMQLIIVAVYSYFNEDFRYKFTVNFKDTYLKPMMIMALPIIFGSQVNQINNLIDQAIASQIGTGSQSIVNYANKISNSVYTLFVISLTTAMYPSIIKQASDKNYDGMKSTLNEIMNIIALVVIPATVGIIVLAAPTTRLFYGRGGSSAPAIQQAIRFALMGASIGLIGSSIKDVLVRAFYALGDSLTPVITSAIAVALNIALNFALAPIFKEAGLTLATSISAIVGMALLYVLLHRKLGGLQTRKLLDTMTKITISSLVMGAVVFVVYNVLNNDTIHYMIPFVISMGVGVVVYAAGLIMFKVKEFTDLINMIFKKLKIEKRI